MGEYIALYFIISPIIRYLCSSGRKWNAKRKYTGRVVTYFILTCIIIYKVINKDKNCFQLLNVTPFSSFDVIRKSFKTVAFNLHPDRNMSKTASEDYSNLVELYKYISSPENKYKYTRFFDLLKKDQRAFHDISVLELISLAMMKSFMTIASTFFILFTNGENVLWHPLLVYGIFNTFFDLYLRLSDELFFTTKVPFIKYFVTFEILSIFNEFKAFFIHYSSMFPDDSRLGMSVSSNILANNIKVLDVLDSLLRRVRNNLGLANFKFTYTPDQKVQNLSKEIRESNRTIEKLYKRTFFLPWSKESRKEYSVLSAHGDKVSSESGSVFSFIITSSIILFSFLNN